MRVIIIALTGLLFLSGCKKSDIDVPVIPPDNTTSPAVPVEPVDPEEPVQNQISLTAGVTEYSINLGGSQRKFSIQIPQGFDTKQQYPVVFLLKGKSGGDEDGFGAWIDKFRGIIDSRQYIGVYPQSKTGEWIMGFNGEDNPMEDVEFISEIVDLLKVSGTINVNKLYTLGISNGGCMAQYLAIHTDYFAAVTTVAGSLFEGLWAPAASEVSLLHIHGKLDNSVPYYGGFAHNLEFYSVPQSIETWAIHNGCDSAPVVDLSVPEAIVYKYNYCDPQIETILFSVPDAGHSVYSSYDGIDLNGFVFDFFSRHSR